jgi:hypothetical protein
MKATISIALVVLSSIASIQPASAQAGDPARGRESMSKMSVSYAENPTEYLRQWRIKNKEHVRAYARRYRERVCAPWHHRGRP